MTYVKPGSALLAEVVEPAMPRYVSIILRFKPEADQPICDATVRIDNVERNLALKIVEHWNKRVEVE